MERGAVLVGKGEGREKRPENVPWNQESRDKMDGWGRGRLSRRLHRERKR
jgi:hypothetical protein